MHPQAPLRDAERDNYAFFLDLPDTARVDLPKVDHKTSQFLEPLFEYSGACAGCGETPYIKLLTQLFGDRALVANATGCSSIYGGNLPTTPFTHEPRRARAGVVELAVRGQRGVRPRPAPRRRQSHARGARAGGIHGRADRRAPRRRTARRRPVDGSGDPRAARAGARAATGARAARHGRGAPPRSARRLPREEEHLAGGRRWVGLRHRVRRPRPHPGQPARREHPRARHGGLFQYRRPAVEGDAARRGGQVRVGRQDDPEEGSRPARQHVRPRLCGAGGLRREDEPDRPGLSRGRGVPGDVAHHRLQPLHRARLRHGERRDAAEAGGRLGRVAALPLRPAAHRQGRAADASRLWAAEAARRRVHAQRVAVPGRRAQRPRPLQRVPQGGAGSGPSALRDVPAARGHHRAASPR